MTVYKKLTRIDRYNHLYEIEIESVLQNKWFPVDSMIIGFYNIQIGIKIKLLQCIDYEQSTSSKHNFALFYFHSIYQCTTIYVYNTDQSCKHCNFTLMRKICKIMKAIDFIPLIVKKIRSCLFVIGGMHYLYIISKLSCLLKLPNIFTRMRDRRLYTMKSFYTIT